MTTSIISSAGTGTDNGALADPEDSARAVGLRYVRDDRPGIRRKRTRTAFRYVGPDGSPVRDEATLRRIQSLAIPPAWTGVWISPLSNGHIQATGRDAKNRKQYRYHPRWRDVRDETKFNRMLAFGDALPHIREQVDRDLALHGLPREKVLATVVRLLETTLIRVGNDEYARDNGSFGLTTMRDRHVDVDGSRVEFAFTGKSGKKYRIDLRDRRLAGVVKRCRDIPGYELFQYIDEDGNRRVIDSGDVNDYLRQITGQDFTAKDFRTWTGTVLATLALQEFEQFDSDVQARRNVVRAVERVAERLGNTPAVSRKSYIHPAVIDTYLDGTMLEMLRARTEEELVRELPNLSPEEAAVMTLLQQRLAREQEQDRSNAVAARTRD